MGSLNKNQVSSYEIPSRKGSSGTANIVIPKDIPRDLFISECQKNSTVSILTEDNERIDNVLVSEDIWNFISFPKSYKELGSRVAWINIPKYNQPIIVGKINKQNELTPRNEEEFLIKKEIKGKGSIEFSIDPINNSILLNLNSLEESGSIDIKVKSKGKGQLNLVSDGSVNIKAPNIQGVVSEEFNLSIQNLEIQQEITKIKYTLGEGLTYSDEFNNNLILDREKIQINTETQIILGEGKEPIVLAETCKKVLDKFIDLVSKATVATSLGQMPLLNRVSIDALKEETDSFFSTITKSD